MVSESHEWRGTASELLDCLRDSLDSDVKPNVLSRRLKASSSRLSQEYGVSYRSERSQEARIIYLSQLRYDGNDANDDISDTGLISQIPS